MNRDTFSPSLGNRLSLSPDWAVKLCVKFRIILQGVLTSPAPGDGVYMDSSGRI